MGAGFSEHFLAKNMTAGMAAFLSDLQALSRPRYCRDMHPDAADPASGILGIYLRLRRNLSIRCAVMCPSLSPLRERGPEGMYEPQLRSIAAELFDIPPEYRRVEAPESFQAAVIAHLTPVREFDSSRTGTDPYQMDNAFVQDIKRELFRVAAFTRDALGNRVEIDLFSQQQELLEEGRDDAAFALNVAQRICGFDRKTVYAVTSVLHQGACNGVLASLFAPGVRTLFGFPCLPMVFSSRPGIKKIYVDRLHNGDYLLSTLWRNAIHMGGQINPNGGWRDMVEARSRQSQFGIDICIRLREEDMARGLCVPVLEHLFLEMGFVPKQA